MMTLKNDAESDDVYLLGSDAGREAAKRGDDPDDAIVLDLDTWAAENMVTTPELEQVYRDGWWKSYRDARAKLRARLRSVV
jgi:hypothetical protein